MNGYPDFVSVPGPKSRQASSVFSSTHVAFPLRLGEPEAAVDELLRHDVELAQLVGILAAVRQRDETASLLGAEAGRAVPHPVRDPRASRACRRRARSPIRGSRSDSSPASCGAGCRARAWGAARSCRSCVPRMSGVAMRSVASTMRSASSMQLLRSADRPGGCRAISRCGPSPTASRGRPRCPRARGRGRRSRRRGCSPMRPVRCSLGKRSEKSCRRQGAGTQSGAKCRIGRPRWESTGYSNSSAGVRWRGAQRRSLDWRSG